jgi:hypothetical protein
MRELSDKVVEWQEAHKDISGELVAQKIRAAQLQTEHDNLRRMIRDLMAKQSQTEQAQAQAQARVSGPQTIPKLPKVPMGRKAASSANAGPTSKTRIGFLGRLKTPRNRE